MAMSNPLGFCRVHVFNNYVHQLLCYYHFNTARQEFGIEESLNLKCMEELNSLQGNSRPGECQCIEMSNCVFVSLMPEKWNTSYCTKDFDHLSLDCVYIDYYIINLENDSSNKLREVSWHLFVSFN